MTDEPQVPMSEQPDPASAPTQPSAIPPLDTRSLPPVQAETPPVAPASGWPPPAAAPSSWSGAPSWGSAPQGWPPPPSVPPPLSPPTSAAPPGGTPPPYGPPPAGPGGPGGPGWGYGYGAPGYGAPGYGAPPAPHRPSPLAHKILTGVAIVALAIASAGIGAAISAATHGTSNNQTAAIAPSTPNGNGNGNSNGLDPFGNGSGFPFDLGNGSSGNGSSGNSSSGNGAPAAITTKVNPSVVDIFTTIDTGTSRGEAAGTGMIVSSDGEVLTNNHVIDGATEIRVEVVATGETHTAKVLGYDVVDDVALLKIDDISKLTTIQTAEASTVQVGDTVVAIGNAGGRGGTPVASSGSVTTLDQKVTAGDSGSGDSETLHGMIQVSAPIEPGDSGGPLVDSDGRVIGMNTAAAQSDGFFGGTSSTTAFAIPIEKAMQIIEQIRDGNNSDTVHVGDRAILGVEVRNVPQVGTSAPVSSGAAIVGVRDGAPADQAGMGDGDVITAVDGNTVRNASDLTALMFKYHPGDKVDLTWVDSDGGNHSDTLALIAGPPN